MEDPRIIALFFARDERAVAETAEKYGALCMRIAEQILGSRTDAEEVVNDAYFRLWNAIPPTSPAHFQAFVLTLTRRAALDVTFADVNPDAAAEDFNGEWSIQYIASDGEVYANETGEITADIAIKDGGITFGSGSGFSEVFGDKALKMEYADGTFSYSSVNVSSHLSFHAG